MERPHSRLVRTHEVTKTEKRGCRRNEAAVTAVMDKRDAKESRGDGEGEEVDGDDSERESDGDGERESDDNGERESDDNGERESDNDGERESDDDSESEEKSKRMMAMMNKMRRCYGAAAVCRLNDFEVEIRYRAITSKGRRPGALEL